MNESFGSTDPEQFVRTLADLVRQVTRAAPAPRELPFFGLDHPIGCGSRLLDRLSDLGIFRFYERVLDIDAGIGGPGRWLARRKGCSVVSVNSMRGGSRAARYLVERAHLVGQVELIQANQKQLPLGDRTMTQAWCVEALHGYSDLQTVFREVYRVLRPGGQLAIQERLLPDGKTTQGTGDSVASYCEALNSAGFIGVACASVGGLEEPLSTHALVIRDRLCQQPALETLGESRRILDLVQIIAQKPVSIA